MTEKLKPEQRKLWRRIWFIEYETNGCSAEASKEEADKVVAQWEARGAFDETTDAAPTTLQAQAWHLVATTLRDKFPEAFEKVFAALREDPRSVEAWSEIVRMRDAKPSSTPLSDTERLASLRESFESGSNEVTINGITAGRVIHWNVRDDLDKPVVHLTLTVKESFSLLS